MNNAISTCDCHGNFACCSQGIKLNDQLLLKCRIPNQLTADETVEAWDKYQKVIDKLLVRMGKEHSRLDLAARMVLVRNLGGVRTRIALLPTLGRSTMHIAEKFGLSEIVYRLAGEFSLMELSAAAGYRTFCFPGLVKGLMKTGKMQGRSVTRMIDTFEFLKTMVLHPVHDKRVVEQFRRTNRLHANYKVAGNVSEEARDLFKYIALNMFYIGPSMRVDLTPEERHAICGLTVLVAKKMGHTISGSVKELEDFIYHFELANMFDTNDHSNPLRKQAVEIARASRCALDEIPTISPQRIHALVPHRVKQILAIDY